MTTSFGTHVTRRRFLTALGLTTGAALLAGCASNGAGGATGGGSTSNQVAIMDWDPIKDDPLDHVLTQFTKENPQLKVKAEPTPADYEAKMRTLLAAGTPPDIMRVNDDYVRGYSVKNQLLDLNPYLKQDNVNRDNYFTFIFDFPKQPDGKYTAWAIGNQPRVIFYNVNAFKEAGVPLPPTTWTDENWKWNDFVATAKKLTVPGKRWGALVYDDTGFEQTFSVDNGDVDGVYSADGKKFTLADPKGAESVQWVTDLTCTQHVQPDRALLQQQAANSLFVGGQIGMFFRTFGVTPYLRKNVKNFEWDVAPVPGNVQQKSEGSLIVFCVPKVAKNPDNAWKVLSFLGGPTGGKIFADDGAFVPVLKSAAQGIKPGKEPPAHIDLFVKAMEYQTSIHFTENTERARQIYRPELDLVFTCKEPAQTALNKVRANVEDSLVGKY